LLLQACVYLGPIDHYLGLLAAALGQHQSAGEHFEEALRRHMAPTAAVETHCEYGRLLAARSDTRARGQAMLALGRDNAERFGLTRLQERASAALLALAH
jgi:nitrate reductase assembly molybdenum cofactor insertion protein NarJ